MFGGGGSRRTGAPGAAVGNPGGRNRPLRLAADYDPAGPGGLLDSTVSAGELGPTTLGGGALVQV